jgi:hypothetical protein
VAGVGASLSPHSDGSFDRHVFAISISALAGSFDALNDLEAFTIEQHVLSKLTRTVYRSSHDPPPPVASLPI